MVRRFIIFLFLFTLAAPILCFAEEELAPGSDQCLENAVSTVDQKECISQAYLYWDKILNANYKKAMAYCADSERPEQCKANLKKAEKLWVQYKDAMVPVIEELNGGGTLSGVMSDHFYASETKKQAQLLQVE